MNGRALTLGAALTGAVSLIIWQLGDVLTALIGPELATLLAVSAWECIVILLIAAGAIIVGWTTTEVFKRGMYDPDEWVEQRRRFWLCSFVWTTTMNFGLLSLRYVHDAPARRVVEVVAYLAMWTIVVGGASIPIYDVAVKRLWPRIRRMWPTKVVRLADGTEEDRPLDEPSTEGERTIVTERRPAE